jgi:O-antigen/teichoic acid export membrane protein
MAPTKLGTRRSTGSYPIPAYHSFLAPGGVDRFKQGSSLVTSRGKGSPEIEGGGSRSFLSALTRVGGASAFAQLAAIAIAPILTRLYTQDEFGTFGVFLSIATILAAVAPLGYPEGILAPPNRRQSDALFAASLYSSVVVGTACAALTASITSQYPWGQVALPWWLSFLLVPTSIGMAIIYSIQIFVAREANWRAVQDLVIAQACLRVFLQLSFALSGLGAAGLVWAEALMRSFTAAFGLWRIRFPLAERVRLISFRDVAAEAKRYWRFPAIRMPSSLINNVATLAPAPLVAAIYGLGSAGLWVLVDQIINVPLGFVNKTVGDVFAGYFTKAFHHDPAEAKKLFWTAAAALLPIGLVPCAALWFFGPALFAIVFGETWRPAGELAGTMALVLLARFVVQPLSWACNTVNRPEAKLAFDLLQLLLVGAAFAFSYRADLHFEECVRLLAGAYILAYVALLGLTVWAINAPRPTVED